MKSAICGLFVAIASLDAQAGPLLRADLPADPAWLLHVDCDKLRPTAIGQYILKQMADPKAEAKLTAFQTVFNVDLRTQLHGVTLYGASSAPSNGVALIYADFDTERLVTLAKAADDYESSTHSTMTIHSWVDKNKKPKKGESKRTYAAIYGNRVIIFGQNAEKVGQALDVLVGTTANLASTKDFPRLGVSGSPDFLEGGIRKLDVAQGDPSATVLKLAKVIQLQVGESQGQVNAEINLETTSKDVAAQILSVVQGLQSLARLQEDKPEAAKLADAVSIQQTDANVVVSLTLPADAVVEHMKAVAARKAQKKAKESAN